MIICACVLLNAFARNLFGISGFLLEKGILVILHSEVFCSFGEQG